MSEGRVAIVTGGAAGIGRETVNLLTMSGAWVVIADVDAAAADALASSTPRAVSVPTDVRDAAQVDRLFEAVHERFGRLDALVNAAGAAPRHPGLTCTLADEDTARAIEVVDVHLKGTFLTMRRALPILLAADRGAIVNVLSSLARTAVAGQAAYVASKHAALALTECAAKEVEGTSVRVNGVSPGLVRSATLGRLVGVDSLRSPWRAALARRGRSAADAARAIAWLLSDDAAGVHAQVLEIGPMRW